MDTQATPPVANDANTPVDARADALKTFEDLADSFFDDEEEPAAVDGEEPNDELTEDDIPDEEEADDLPPIEAPVSWDAEAKEKFAGLPRDVQEYVQKRESERERFVQTKSQEAARARQDVEQAALQQLAAYEQQVSEQLSQYAQQLEVPKPDPALLATDPVAYAYQARKYEDALAQRTNAQQAAHQYAEQAKQREAYADQVRLQQEHQLIVEKFPEYTDPTTGPKLQQELSAVAREMGYPPELIAQARATDILAIRAAAEWKAKAARYDALNAKKMEKVRAAKGLPRVAKPGVAVSSDQSRQTRSTAAFDRAKAGRNLSEKADGFAEWAKINGLV